ncbi:MAG: energy transducer TonB [Bacteroidota bacterium]
MSLPRLSAQNQSPKGQDTYPQNLDQFLSKIDSVRAPKSEGLVFVRVWLDSQIQYERAEVLAHTNAELASWVKQYISHLNWGNDSIEAGWTDLRLEFKPLANPPFTALAFVEAKDYSYTTPLVINGVYIQHIPYQLPYISLDANELVAVNKKIPPATIVERSFLSIKRPVVPVPEFMEAYLPLETEGLASIELSRLKSSDITPVLSWPSLDMQPLLGWKSQYLPLETEAISTLPLKTELTRCLTHKVEIPLGVYVPSVERSAFYLPLDCEGLDTVSIELSPALVLSRKIEMPLGLAVPSVERSAFYLPLETEALSHILQPLPFEAVLYDFSQRIPDWKAPVYALAPLFDPIDTKGLTPIVKGFAGLSAPNFFAPVIFVERPSFRFRTFLDTEDLSALEHHLEFDNSISPVMEMSFDWRPEIPTSGLDYWDLEREVNIPWMPEVAIYPQNMQDILDRIPYPETARKLELEGEVRFRIWIDEEGHYIRHEVMASLPYLTRLCEYLLPDVEYVPVLLNGNPVPFRTEISFYFDMNRGNPSQCFYQDTKVTDDEFSN